MSYSRITKEAGYTTASRMKRLEERLDGIDDIISRLYKNNTVLAVSSLIALSDTEPNLTDNGPVIWIRTALQPWRYYARQQNGSGLYEWIEFSRGNP